MRIMILETDENLGIEKGEIYSAKRYRFDPMEKYTLIEREPDGYDPECNQYIDEVATWVQGQWMIPSDGKFVPLEGQV